MPEADILDLEPPPPPGRQRNEPRWRFLRHLLDRTPLRTKLITAVLALVILALAAVSIASTYMLRGYVTTQRDADLQHVFNGISWNHAPVGSAYQLQSGMVAGVQQPGRQLTWAQNDFPFASGNQESLPELPVSSTWANGANPVMATVPAQSGPDTWRVIANTQTLQVVSPGGSQQTETVTLVLAVDLGNISALTTRLVLFDLTVGGAIVVVLAAVGVAAVRANLRPLNDIEMIAGQIAKGHLNHRIPERDPRTEVGSLGRSLNAMLAQIEAAFHAQEESERAAHESEERMRRFVADASHELRTPLTTIRGFAAHYRQRGGADGHLGSAGYGFPGTGLRAGEEDRLSRTEAASAEPANSAAHGVVAAAGLSAADVDHLMSRVEAEATRMGLLVEDLLTLARLDQQRPLNLTPVDLLTVAADTVQDARIVSPERPIDLQVATGTAFLVDGDEPRLRQVLANLVNNALTHTPAGTPVRVKIAPGTLEPPDASAAAAGPNGTAGGTEPPGTGSSGPVPAVVLDVEDDGPGMTPEQARRVFERFYRADAARNRASGGTGLGLAIVAGLVAAHGGTVSLRTAPGQGADFQVRLPLSPDALLPDDPGEDA